MGTKRHAAWVRVEQRWFGGWRVRWEQIQADDRVTEVRSVPGSPCRFWHGTFRGQAVHLGRGVKMSRKFALLDDAARFANGLQQGRIP